MIAQLEAYIQDEGDKMVMFVIDAQKKCREELWRMVYGFFVRRIVPRIILNLQITVISSRQISVINRKSKRKGNLQPLPLFSRGFLSDSRRKPCLSIKAKFCVNGARAIRNYWRVRTLRVTLRK